VQIIKRLFAEGPVTFSGTYYRVSGLEGYPKPLQRPSPRLFIGGSGKRMLALAAREAAIVGLLMRLQGMRLDFTDGSLAATAQRIDWVRHAAGERFATLEFNTLVFGLAITEHRQSAAEQLAAAYGTSAESVVDSIHFLVGTVEQIVEQIQMWRERLGISYVTVIPEHLETFAPVVARLAGA
jgi:alkanesulfonate monooxygenase SsuD/methylene tetrahydromethanopterin reductase-like flavin-dependent oxidoreductase (luciferase family)